jgi:hypothetical protein
MTIVVIGEAAITTSFFAEPAGAVPYNMLWASSGDAQFFGAGSLTGTTSIAGPSAIMVTDDGTTSHLYVGDLSTPQATAGPVIGTGTAFDLLAGTAGVPGLTGKLAEIIIWGGILPVGDLTELKAYFNTTQAYGLGVT